jgi:hypothetical protein
VYKHSVEFTVAVLLRQFLCLLRAAGQLLSSCKANRLAFKASEVEGHGLSCLKEQMRLREDIRPVTRLSCVQEVRGSKSVREPFIATIC